MYDIINYGTMICISINYGTIYDMYDMINYGTMICMILLIMVYTMIIFMVFNFTYLLN